MNLRTIHLSVLTMIFIGANEFIAAHPMSTDLLSTTNCIPVPNGSEIYYGVYVRQTDTINMAAVDTFENHAQKKVSIIQFYSPWDSGQGTFKTAFFDSIRNHCSIPLITWTPKQSGQDTNQPYYTLKNIIDSVFDNYIREYAYAIKAWGYPIFLRFAHEMNGNWYPWSETVNQNQQGQYVLAWRHVHDIFTQCKVPNVTWVWCPSRVNTGPYPLSEYYPGDDYVDWIGMDGYNQCDTNSVPQQKWESFTQVFNNLYKKILSINNKKPIMVAEFSSTEYGGSKADWITNALLTEIPDTFQNIHAIVWFNVNSGKQLDWRIESSTSAKNAFASAINSLLYTSNEYCSLKVPVVPGTKEISHFFNTSVYPNPARDNISIKVKSGVPGVGGKIQIFDVIGNLVLERTLNNAQNIDISGFSKGIYFVKINTEIGVEVKTFIKDGDFSTHRRNIP